MENRKFRWMAEHRLLRHPFFAFESENFSLKETRIRIWYFLQTNLHADLRTLLQADL